MDDVRLCVLVSGSGTILEAMIRAGLPVALVASDRRCRGLDLAFGAGVETLLVSREEFGGFAKSFDRDGFTRELTTALQVREIDLIAMAGFGTIVTAPFHVAYPGRVLNTHPSLLPAFKGWHAVAQALESGVSETGCTVHIATEELDDGPILAQRRVPIEPDDTEATLHERIKSVERELYPLVVGRVMAAMYEGDEPASIAGTLED
ncbi:MAG: phosphoribosylglycinamide formyltransferase [Acidimicrobiales bacterium]